MRNIFDTHAHYDDERFDEDRDELLSSLKDKGVSFVVNCGCDLKTCLKTIDMAEKYNPDEVNVVSLVDENGVEADFEIIGNIENEGCFCVAYTLKHTLNYERYTVKWFGKSNHTQNSGAKRDNLTVVGKES